MNILLAPNSMKGSLSAFEFADIAEKALIASSPEFKVRKVPVADGGDLTGEILAKALHADVIPKEVHNPVGAKINSKYYVSGNSAIIEMAEASGMKLIDSTELNPLKTSTFGTGELISHAIRHECSEILLAIGGSATVDGGMGMLEALGFTFFDINGHVLKGNGFNLNKITEIRIPEIISKTAIKIITDVDNPLLGDKGAAVVFGPQKGATREMVALLENGLKNWAALLHNKTKKDCAHLEGAGAAGGISVPLLSFFNAEIVRGADYVLSVLNFDKQVEWAEVVITGEGKIDSQTLNNKAPFAVAKRAAKQNKPVIAIGGIAEKREWDAFDGVFSISENAPDIDYAMKNAGSLLYDFMFGFADKLENIVKKKLDEY